MLTRLEYKEQIAESLEQARQEGAVHDVMAKLGRHSLFFLLIELFNRKDADNDFVYERCLEVQNDPDGYLDLWARGHFKSSIITFALTVQDILKNPEIKVGVFSHTKSIARAFLQQIKREFEGNTVLKEIYSDVLYENPQKESPKWSEEGGIIVKRKGNPKEATVEAWGLVDGQPTSKHYDLMVFDDVVTLESVTTPEQIKKTTDAWAMSLNLGSTHTTKRYIGTRYHQNDTYRDIIKRGSAIPRIVKATVDGTVEGEPVYLTREQLQEKYKDQGSYVFSCQMLQDPVADQAQGFKPEWLNYWPAKEWKGWNLYLIVDPASEKKRGSDYTVMVVIGLAPDGNYYLIHGIRDRLNLRERAITLIQLHREYRPCGTGYEKYGMQCDIEYVKEVQERENYRFPIVELGGSMSKFDRIRLLIPPFQEAKFYIPARDLFIDSKGQAHDFTRLLIDEEFLSFPVSSHDDMLDCIARIKDPMLQTKFPIKPTINQSSKPQFAPKYQPIK